MEKIIPTAITKKVWEAVHKLFPTIFGKMRKIHERGQVAFFFPPFLWNKDVHGRNKGKHGDKISVAPNA